MWTLFETIIKYHQCGLTVCVSLVLPEAGNCPGLGYYTVIIVKYLDGSAANDIIAGWVCVCVCVCPLTAASLIVVMKQPAPPCYLSCVLVSKDTVIIAYTMGGFKGMCMFMSVCV